VIYKTRKRYRGEPICADPTADPRENETALHFTAGDRRLWISSYEPAVISGLLAHPDFRVGHLVLMRVGGRECVVGVVGRLPVGVLSLGRARQSDSHELIVSSKTCAQRANSKKTKKSKKKILKRHAHRALRRARKRVKHLRKRSRK
jgi:hypothetical protein